jgi:hypothetical protein
MLRKSLFAVGAVAFLFAGTAAAQDSNVNQRTYFTFSAPIELPGKTLPAGTYLFRLVDSPSNRHIVQVFDKGEKQIFATILAIPAQRLEPSSDPEVRFMEAAASQPAPIKTWWFPGRTIGHEFIYPKEQAARLARAGGSVLTVATDASTAETMREAELARMSAAGETTRVTTTTTATEVSGTAFPGQTVTQTTQVAVTTPPPAETPSTTVPQSTAVTQRPVDAPVVTPTQEVTTTATRTTTTRTELPRTATFLPLVALFGLASLAGAAALRLRRK